MECNAANAVFEIRKDAAASRDELYFLEADHAFLDFFGVAYEEMAGSPLRESSARLVNDFFSWEQLEAYCTHGNDPVSVRKSYSKAREKWFEIRISRLGETFIVLQLRDFTAHSKEFDELKLKAEFYQNAIKGSNVGIWQWKVPTGEQIINERWAEIIGYSIDDFVSFNIDTWKRLTHPEDMVESEKILQKAFAEESQYYTLEFRMRHKNGNWIWIESMCSIISWIAPGLPLLISGTHIDITKRKMAENELMENQRRLAEAQRIAKIGYWELDPGTGEIWASSEMCAIYGIDFSDIFEPMQRFEDRVLPEDLETIDRALARLVHENERYDVRYRIVNGRTMETIHVHAAAVINDDTIGGSGNIIGTIQDVTEQSLRQEELIYLCFHDQLTGLYNRRYYEEALIRLDQAKYLPVTILLCDVNGLKMVNDSFGHNIGDQLLIRAAEVIRKACGDQDVAARYGGDEFAVILTNTDKEAADRFMERIRALAMNESVGSINLSLSMGCQTKSDPNHRIQIVSNNAEDAMYRQKLYEGRGSKSKMIDLIINTLYEKNNREMHHSKRVGKLCRAIAEVMGLGKELADQIHIAGLMHDIGKIGINDSILNKAEPLSDHEWELIKEHPEIGFRILSSVSEFEEIAGFVLEYHERWDGAGYPRKLYGEGISLPARIIAIADTYDAMTVARPYRRAYSKDEAFREIERCVGGQFDPGLVDLAIRTFIENDEDFGYTN